MWPFSFFKQHLLHDIDIFTKRKRRNKQLACFLRFWIPWSFSRWEVLLSWSYLSGVGGHLPVLLARRDVDAGTKVGRILDVLRGTCARVYWSSKRSSCHKFVDRGFRRFVCKLKKCATGHEGVLIFCKPSRQGYLFPPRGEGVGSVGLVVVYPNFERSVLGCITPIFRSRNSPCRIFRDLQNWRAFGPLRTQHLYFSSN